MHSKSCVGACLYTCAVGSHGQSNVWGAWCAHRAGAARFYSLTSVPVCDCVSAVSVRNYSSYTCFSSHRQQAARLVSYAMSRGAPPSHVSHVTAHAAHIAARPAVPSRPGLPVRRERRARRHSRRGARRGSLAHRPQRTARARRASLPNGSAHRQPAPVRPARARRRCARRGRLEWHCLCRPTGLRHTRLGTAPQPAEGAAAHGPGR